jgi:4,5-DOPA dioxygenase extradiol
MSKRPIIEGSGNVRMPVLFVGHGSPMNIISNNDFTRRLVRCGKEMPLPSAVLVVSAHWLTNGVRVTCAKWPKTIYDFYGFPDELYKMEYPCPGAPEVAKLARDLVTKTEVKCDFDWGLDHASWSVLKHMYPDAHVPVLEMSLDYSPYNEWHPKSLRYYYDLASELAPLRERGVLIMGSGNIVHNLGLIDLDGDAKPFEWAVNFDEKVKDRLMKNDHEALMDYRNFGKTVALSVPTLDHYLPMICALGLQGKDEPLKFVYEGFQNGSVSMRCFQIG